MSQHRLSLLPLLLLVLTPAVTLSSVTSSRQSGLSQQLEAAPPEERIDMQTVAVNAPVNATINLPLPFGQSLILSAGSLFKELPLWHKSNPAGGNGLTSSTVYTLSFVNLFAILSIKLLLFLSVFGVFGFAGLASGRSLDSSSSLLDERDLMFALAFLGGNDDIGYSCLQRAACVWTDRANDILVAGSMLEKMVVIYNSLTSQSPHEPHAALSSLREAVDYSQSSDDCMQRYLCPAPSL